MAAAQRRAAQPPLLALLLALQFLGPLAQLAVPALLPRYPLLLLLANANDALATLASPHLSSLGFYTAVLARRTAEDCLYFAAGRHYGQPALARLGLPQQSPAMSWLALALFPAAPLHLLAGAARTPPLQFAVVALLGSLLRAAALRRASVWAGAYLQHPALLIATLAVPLLQLLNILRRQGTSNLHTQLR